MRILKVGLCKASAPYSKIPKAHRTKKLMPVEPVMLEFSDGHTCRCVLSRAVDSTCYSCCIRRHADTLDLHFVCPRANDRVGRLLCDTHTDACYEFHELSTILEDI